MLSLCKPRDLASRSHILTLSSVFIAFLISSTSTHCHIMQGAVFCYCCCSQGYWWMLLLFSLSQCWGWLTHWLSVPGLWHRDFALFLHVYTQFFHALTLGVCSNDWITLAGLLMSSSLNPFQLTSLFFIVLRLCYNSVLWLLLLLLMISFIRVMLRGLSPVLQDAEDLAWHIWALNYTQHHFSGYNYFHINHPETFFIVFVGEKYNHIVLSKGKSMKSLCYCLGE